MKRTILATMLATVAVAALLAVTAASAGRLQATITLDGSSSGAFSTTASAPKLGGSVGFTVTASTSKPSDMYSLWVANKCYQNGVVVSAEYQSVQNGHAGPFTLGPTAGWTSGGASCTAYVWMFPNSETPIRGATVNYSVAP